MNSRPSHKEISGKLKQARTLLCSYYPVDPLTLGSDFQELKLYLTDEQCDGLRAAFAEVTASNYQGSRPPQKSIEAIVLGDEMFTFIWDSVYFKRKMYLKFCLHESDDVDGFDLFVFSLHPDRPKAKANKK